MLFRGPMAYFETQTCATVTGFPAGMGQSCGKPTGMEAIPWEWGRERDLKIFLHGDGMILTL